MRLNEAILVMDDVKHRLSTNTLSNTKRIQRWGNFIAGFSIEFVEECLKGYSPSSGLILDPFAGCGTTLVAARNMDFDAVGYELHPVFYEITKAKIGNYSECGLNEIFHLLRNQKNFISWSEDAAKFLTKMFIEENLEAIGSASAQLNFLPENLRSLGVAAFLKACEYACGSQTDGIYKAPTSKKRHMAFSSALNKVEEELREDIQSRWYRNCWLEKPNAILRHKSATEITELEKDSVSCCITSPPYLNNFDYAEMTRMHLYLLGWCSSWRDISERIRNHLITNTTTAIKYKKTEKYQNEAKAYIPSVLVQKLEPLVDELKFQRMNRPGKKEYDYLIYPYYSEITKVLRSIFSALMTGGRIHWVVADAALYGVHLETHVHTACIMHELGFRNIQISFMRQRGHRWVLSKRDGAKKGLGEYHIEAIK